MELLVSLCSVPVLRKLVCETVLRPPAPRLQPATRKGVQARGSEPSLALVHWVTSPLDGPEQCYMQALSLLAELFEVCQCFNSVYLNNPSQNTYCSKTVLQRIVPNKHLTE